MAITLPASHLAPPPAARPPLGGLSPATVAGLHDELLASHQEVAPLFQRAAPRPGALTNREGPLRPLARKSIAPMADALAGGNVQARQQCSSVGTGADDAVLRRPQPLGAEPLGAAETGVLMLDGSAFPTQGAHAVGVARQGCGAWGTVVKDSSRNNLDNSTRLW